MKRFKPTIWLSFGLASLTLALALTAYVLGLMPDGYKVELESRAKVAEALAVQLAGAANRNDGLTLEETLNSVVERNDDVFSSALRRADGSIVLSAGDHEAHWVPSKDGKSTPTHVTVPLFGADGPQGAIELSFGPASSANRILGVPTSLLMFLGFLMATGFIGYFLLLRRTLRELDPGRVIPERVQKAFDTLNEGVIILDEKERILLVNRAFAEIYDQKSGPAIGSKINTLSWRMVDGRAQAGGYPWHAAIIEGREARKELLSLRVKDGTIHNFNVNATIISNDNNKTIGAIVTLSDMTSLKHNKEELEKTVEKLLQSEESVEHQRHELQYLASHDSLSGCLNRKSLFQRLGSELEKEAAETEWLSVLLLDIDRFIQLNHDYGTATGDRVIAGIAEILRGAVGNLGYVARYGGDQFCIVLPGADAKISDEFGKALLMDISAGAQKIFAGGGALTVTIGITSKSGDGFAAQTLIKRATEALQAGKQQSGNCVVRWNTALETNNQSVSAPDATLHKPVAQGPSGFITSQSPATMQTGNVDLAGFFGRVDQTLSQADLSGKQTALLQIAVGSWDYLNEALGDKGSQDLMEAIKRKTVEMLRERDDLIALPNRGELLINIMELHNRDNLEWSVQKLLESLRTPFNINGHPIYVACNAGVALSPDDGTTALILNRNAGTALRRAQQENEVNGYKFFSADMVQSSQERLDIESGIREALQRDEFELHFQPIVDLQTGALSSAECLLRCNTQSLSGIYMDKIIGVAEKSSLIAEIDMWVLRTALRQMQHWCDTGYCLPKISINLSANQFTDVDFMDRVFDTIRAVRFSPSRVQIEVTETSRMADVNTAASQLKRLQQLGVLIALDDFGTGQSSLTYLQRLHPDVIKIDRSFVTGVNANHANATLVSAMTVMAHCLGLKVVAEGVEEEEEREFLRQTRCDEMQGYLISRPMPVDVMSDWMNFYVGTHGSAVYSNEMRPVVQADVAPGAHIKAA